MSEVRHTMTGLEVRFEEELSALPGWRREREVFPEPGRDDRAPRPETARERAVEDAMILGN